MHAHAIASPDNGILVASGYGLKVYVERGHLVVHQGVGDRRWTSRFNRATSGLKRLVIVGRTGYVTLDALQWLSNVGAAFVQLDADAHVIALSGSQGTDTPALRRAQALAAGAESGTALARALLSEKLSGQRAVVEETHEAAACHSIEAALEDLQSAEELDRILGAEARAALAYWEALSSFEVRFAKSDLARLPDHWRSFGQRHSPLTDSPRLAATPANALLNYLYALLESEASLACTAVGLDPGLGFFHRDRSARASLALDLMEACRPTVDAYVLGLLREHTFGRGDFAETRRGVCRVLPPLAGHLAKTAAIWREHIAPVAEGVARALAEGSPASISLPTPLTERRRRAAWDARRRKRPRRPRRAPSVPKSCSGCGAELLDSRRRYCDGCLRERFASVAGVGRPAAAAALAQLRSDGRDPAHGGEAARRRGRKNAVHQREVARWEERNGPGDPSIFRAKILPGLRGLGIGELVAATGLSEHYCSLIRLGKRVPHQRHWEVLRAVSRPSRVEKS